MGTQVGELVRAAATGDEAAFTELVARHHRDLLRVAYVICRDAALAEDSAQAAWAIAWRRMGDVKDPTQIRGWLVAVAANEARRTMRSRRPLIHEISVAEVEIEGVPDLRTDPLAAGDRQRRSATSPRLTRSDRPGPDRPAVRGRAQLRRDWPRARDVVIRRPGPSLAPAPSASWRTRRWMTSTCSSGVWRTPFGPTPTRAWRDSSLEPSPTPRWPAHSEAPCASLGGSASGEHPVAGRQLRPPSSR